MEMDILFPHLLEGGNYLGFGLFYAAWSMAKNVEFVYRAHEKDYGDLVDLRFPDEDGQPRAIWYTQTEREGREWEDWDVFDDLWNSYFAFDVCLLQYSKVDDASTRWTG